MKWHFRLQLDDQIELMKKLKNEITFYQWLDYQIELLKKSNYVIALNWYVDDQIERKLIVKSMKQDFKIQLEDQVER